MIVMLAHRNVLCITKRCLKRDDDDHDDNGMGVMIAIIRVMTSSASLLVP